MRALNAVRRILLLLLLIPVVAIVLNALLTAFGAQRQNPIVKTVRDVARFFILEPFTTVFPDQSYIQDALVALAAYGILALLIVFVFRGLRSMVGSRPPKVRSTPAPAAPPKRPVAATKQTDPKQDAKQDPTTEAAGTSGKDSQSTSG